MTPDDIFFGPLLRRAQQDLVVICLATYKEFVLRFSVKEHGGRDWLAHDDFPLPVRVSDGLFFYFGRVSPPKGKSFPTQTLLAYSIGVLTDPDTADYAPFEAVVQIDQLAYGSAPLPTFYLQAPRKKLVAMYGSCRKVHDANGGKADALSAADALVAAHFDTDKRPAILCLGGDQIYADDVHDATMAEVLALAKKIEGGQPEKVPGAAALPGVGGRKDLITKAAKFTTGEGKNHLITFAEYLALYGLMWNGRNWSSKPAQLTHFTDTLPAVRRVLANVPTYMIFDDHDVTDDWNLSVQWREDVRRTPLGTRIVANALMAYWLCQGFANNPDDYGPQRPVELAEVIRDRTAHPDQAETTFWGLTTWEFFTPTYPLIYFLDTRTRRGPRDGSAGMEKGAPAYLKSVPAWAETMKRLRGLLKRQDRELPLVLVAAAPVFGFKFIDDLQAAVSAVAGPYFLDFESWVANPSHLRLFLRLMGDANVVLLSGDVHYGFTSTVRYTQFDDALLRQAVALMPAGTTLPKTPTGATPTYDPLWTARFLQLTSSALKNFASTLFTQAPANATSTDLPRVYTETGGLVSASYENGRFRFRDSPPPDSRPIYKQQTEVKPDGLFFQRINDAYNAAYVSEHNLGVVTFQGKTVTHYFVTPAGKTSERTWDFTNPKPWE